MIELDEVFRILQEQYVSGKVQSFDIFSSPDPTKTKFKIVFFEDPEEEIKPYLKDVEWSIVTNE